MKRSRGLVCKVADGPGGGVWLGGSETGGAKMSDESKSFAGDLAVLLPLPGLVLCGGGIMAMESCAEDCTEFSQPCFTPFGTDSPLGGFSTKGLGEDWLWEPSCSRSETPF